MAASTSTGAAASSETQVQFRPYAREQLRRVVNAPDAVDMLSKYFDPAGTPDKVAWTGGWFERLSDGCEPEGAPDIVTATDLVAVTMLGVAVPASVSVGLLSGALGGRLRALLADVSVGARLETAPAGLVAAGSAADRAWTLMTKPGSTALLDR